jgi:eukaryotic-like serine/threonine-protein kinase
VTFPEDPASFGRYSVLGRIASGGMADVYAGCVKGEAGFERVVAIKRMGSTLATDEEFVEMFLHEARLAAQIRSAHVVQTLDLGRDADGVPYIVMDLVQGATVARLVSGAAWHGLTMPVEVAVSILVDCCRGLHDAHEAKARDGTPLGIVHRDVSPQNILVGEDGLSRVADFGIARAWGAPGERSGRIQGKVAYFSPEQAQSLPLDRRSDIFSLGIVAWEMLTGSRLFRVDDARETLERVRRMPIEDLDAVRPGVPPALAREISRALERDPEARFSSAAEFEDALRAAARKARLHLDPSAVAQFLAAACPKELEHLDQVLRSRLSWTGDLIAPNELQPVDRQATTEPEIDRSSTISGSDRTTEPVRLLEKKISRRPPAASRRSFLGWGLSALAVAALAGLGGFRPIMRMREAARLRASVFRGPPPPPSSRRVLRLGTSFLTTIPGSPVAPAVFWSVFEPGSDGQLKASFLRETPGLDNGAARILPAGQFEVSWSLIPGLQWSDGSALGADDLVLAHQLQPDTRTLQAHKLDDEGAVFVWNDHWARALEPFEPFPASVLGAQAARGGRDAALEFRKMNPTPGLGPYRVVEFKAGERMVLEANPHFAGPAPSMARIDLICVKEPRVLVEKFEKGELDMIVPNSITVEQAEELRKKRPDVVHLRPSQHYVQLQPDLSHPLLSLVEARRALLQAIDRVALTRQIFGRTDLVAHCPVLGLGEGAVQTHPFDLRAASSTLARLGFTGTTLLLFHSSWSVDVLLAEFVKNNLQAAGLTVELKLTDKASELYRKGKHGGLLLYSLRDAGPEIVAAHFNLPATESGYDRAVRHSGFDDWTASLLDREERAVHLDRRAQLRRDLWVAFAERLPVLPLAFRLERIVADPALRGWDDSPSKRFAADLERWYFVR